jgi:signal transduction histidine kinase
MAVITLDSPELGVAHRPFRRTTSTAVIAGVCGGLAVRLGVRARTLRVLFCLAALFFGVGLVAYVGLWLLTPRSGEDQSIAQRLSGERRRSRTVVVVIAAALVLAVFLHVVDQGRWGNFLFPLTLSAAGLLAVWWGATSDEQGHLTGVIGATPLRSISTMRGRRALLWRVVPGVILVIVGLNVLGHIGGIWGAAVPAIVGAAVMLAGILVLLAPWWLQQALDLSEERRQRVRAEERSTMVAHLHDSVLQTLTLIERVAGDEDQVRRLARTQERELRAWLYDGAPDRDGATLASTLQSTAGEVERDYGVTVELVTVGDAPLDEAVAAMAAASREAMLNAAKWSGDSRVSVYSECDGESLSIFVRDRGVGFDPAAVPADRHGIAQSIAARLVAVGASAEVRSSPGSGTEVELTLARAKAAP